jgi:hypothetical protein
MLQPFQFDSATNHEIVLPQPGGTPRYIEVSLYKRKGARNLESPVYFEKIELDTDQDNEGYIYAVENSFYKKLKGTEGEDELTITYDFNMRFWNNWLDTASLYPHEPVYLLQSQRRIEVKVRSESPLTYLDYLGLHTVGSDTPWRLIAAKQDIRTNISTLIFHYSPFFLDDSDENTEQ